MIILLGKRELAALLFLVCGLCTVMVCLFFLLMPLVGYDLWLWLSLDIFYTSSILLSGILIASMKHSNCIEKNMMHPVNTQRRNNVVTRSLQRHDVAATL